MTSLRIASPINVIGQEANITVQSASCNYLGSFGTQPNVYNKFRVVAGGTATYHVPGNSLGVGGDIMYPGWAALTCDSWTGKTDVNDCGSQIGDPPMTNWTRESDFDIQSDDTCLVMELGIWENGTKIAAAQQIISCSDGLFGPRRCP